MAGAVARVKLDEQQGGNFGSEIIDNFLGYGQVTSVVFYNTQVILDDTIVDGIPIHNGGEFGLRHGFSDNTEYGRIGAVLRIGYRFCNLIREPVEFREHTVQQRAPALGADGWIGRFGPVRGRLILENLVTTGRWRILEKGAASIHTDDNDMFVGTFGNRNDRIDDQFRIRTFFCPTRYRDHQQGYRP